MFPDCGKGGCDQEARRRGRQPLDDCDDAFRTHGTTPFRRECGAIANVAHVPKVTMKMYDFRHSPDDAGLS
jgi:hypothetical protein